MDHFSFSFSIFFQVFLFFSLTLPLSLSLSPFPSNHSNEHSPFPSPLFLSAPFLPPGREGLRGPAAGDLLGPRAAAQRHGHARRQRLRKPLRQGGHGLRHHGCPRGALRRQELRGRQQASALTWLVEGFSVNADGICLFLLCLFALHDPSSAAGRWQRTTDCHSCRGIAPSGVRGPGSGTISVAGYTCHWSGRISGHHLQQISASIIACQGACNGLETESCVWRHVSDYCSDVC